MNKPKLKGVIPYYVWLDLPFFGAPYSLLKRTLSECPEYVAGVIRKELISRN